MTKHIKDNLVPRHITPTKTYVIFHEYSPEYPSDPSSSGLMELEQFTDLYNRNQLASCEEDENSWIEVLCTFEASTFEEACAINNLRLHGEPYYPMGEGSPCVQCSDFIVFTDSTCCCPACGHVDEVKQQESHKLYLEKIEAAIARDLEKEFEDGQKE